MFKNRICGGRLLGVTVLEAFSKTCDQFGRPRTFLRLNRKIAENASNQAVRDVGTKRTIASSAENAQRDGSEGRRGVPVHSLISPCKVVLL